MEALQRTSSSPCATQTQAVQLRLCHRGERCILTGFSCALKVKSIPLEKWYLQ